MNFNVFFTEGRLGVLLLASGDAKKYVNKAFGEGWQDIGQCFDKGNLEFIGNFYNKITFKEREELMPGNHLARSSLKKSCNSAANSIPVGPPPTTTICNNRDTSSGV